MKHFKYVFINWNSTAILLLQLSNLEIMFLQILFFCYYRIGNSTIEQLEQGSCEKNKRK